MESEVMLLDERGSFFRPDRIIHGEREIVVMDVKTGSENAEDHEKQVRAYVRLVRLIHPGKAVRGVLLYLDDLRLKDVAA